MSLDRTYTLVSQLGEGGMAEVFKAIKKGPEGFEKPVALKRILPHLIDQKSFVKMLAVEARVHAYLDHPNIVGLLDFFEQDGNFLMVLEYVFGKNLRQMVKDAQDQGLVLAWTTALHIMGEILKGLDFAHKCMGPRGHLKIVHRDISPQNILLSFDGLVKLSDFGIAWANIAREETKSGILKGKCRYLAPEQITGKTMDHRVDIFAAGIVLYELLAHRSPFESESEFETMKRIEGNRYEPLENICPTLDTRIVEAVAMAMKLSPADRFQEASEFRQALLCAQDPLWLSQGTEQLQRWIHTIYPHQKEREEKPLERTMVLSKHGHNLPPVLVATNAWESEPAQMKRRTVSPALRWTLLIVGSVLLGLMISIFNPFENKTSEWAVSNFSPQQPAVVGETPPIIVREPEIRPEIVSLSRSSPAASHIKSQSTGFLHFEGPYGSRVFVNGQQIGTLPIRTYSLPQGDYVVLIDPSRGPKSMNRVKVKPGKIHTVYWSQRAARFQKPR